VLELSRQEDSDQDFKDTSLHGNDGDDTEDGVGCTPSLEVPEQLEEGDHTNDSREVSHSCHGSTKGVGVRVELLVSM
jgi:hypothetical protein